uniref:G_PROTEIN_RECEP_F1_2 domain-containing protein n=1 Tax=Rhabditophanes sp. KR3021 TaxID=114890 RepID=A0AC35TRH0_9BILA
MDISNKLTNLSERIICGSLIGIILLISCFLNILMIRTIFKVKNVFTKMPVWMILFNMIIADLMKNLVQITVIIPQTFLINSKVIRDYRESLPFAILCEFDTLGYFAWTMLIISLTINRFLTFYSPNLAKKHCFKTIIVTIVLIWISGFLFVALKALFQIIGDYDINGYQIVGYDEINTISPTSIELFHAIQISNLIIPLFLFVLYLLSYLKVRKLVTVSPQFSAPTSSGGSPGNSVNFERIIFFQGLMICSAYEFESIVFYLGNYFVAELGLEQTFYPTILINCLNSAKAVKLEIETTSTVNLLAAAILTSQIL